MSRPEVVIEAVRLLEVAHNVGRDERIGREALRATHERHRAEVVRLKLEHAERADDLARAEADLRRANYKAADLERQVQRLAAALAGIQTPSAPVAPAAPRPRPRPTSRLTPDQVSPQGRAAMNALMRRDPPDPASVELDGEEG